MCVWCGLGGGVGVRCGGGWIWCVRARLLSVCRVNLLCAYFSGNEDPLEDPGESGKGSLSLLFVPLLITKEIALFFRFLSLSLPLFLSWHTPLPPQTDTRTHTHTHS